MGRIKVCCLFVSKELFENTILYLGQWTCAKCKRTRELRMFETEIQAQEYNERMAQLRYELEKPYREKAIKEMMDGGEET